MTLFKMLKHNSRLALKGNWRRAVAVQLVFLSLVFLFSLFREYVLSVFSPGAQPYMSEQNIILLGVFSLSSLMLIIPFEMGLLYWFFSVVNGDSPAFSESFFFFERAKKYFKSIGLYVTIAARSILWAVPFYILPTATTILSYGLINKTYRIAADNDRVNSAIGSMLMVFSVFLFVLVTILYAIYINRYALAVYIYFGNMDLGIHSIIKTSVKYTNGERLNLFLFQLSFIGWCILSLLVIPAFYFLPYYYTSFSMYARYLTERQIPAVQEPTQEFAPPVYSEEAEPNYTDTDEYNTAHKENAGIAEE